MYHLTFPISTQMTILVLRLSRDVMKKSFPIERKMSEIRERSHDNTLSTPESRLVTRIKHAPASWLVVLVSFELLQLSWTTCVAGVDLRWARLRYCFDPWSRGPLYSRVSKWILPLPRRNQLPKFFVQDVEIIEWHWSVLAVIKWWPTKEGAVNARQEEEQPAAKIARGFHREFLAWPNLDGTMRLTSKKSLRTV